MRRNRVIGITGGIGTGKSLVSNYLVKKGYTVIDFDEISRKIYDRGKSAYRDVIDFFGETILDERGEVDRSKLASIVFQDRAKLDILNRITHGHIFEEAKERISDYNGEKPLFLDIPLLYEVRNEIESHGIHIDEVWFIYSGREVQIQRVMKRDNLDYLSAQKRVDAQIPTDEKIKYADRIICNEGEREDVYRRVDALMDLK